jgi:hypothetical protein
MFRRLDNGILFSMKTTAKFMTFTGEHGQFLPQTTDIKTVGNTGWRTVITGGKNIFVLYQDGAHMATETGGPAGNEPGNLHKIFVPGRPFLCVITHISVCTLRFRLPAPFDYKNSIPKKLFAPPVESALPQQ